MNGRPARVRLLLLHVSFYASRMAETPSRTLMRWQFVSIILMSVSLGGMLLIAFENWLRGNSFVWWLGLSALFAFSITAQTVRLLKQVT
jgi:hypothetical protein